MGYWGSHNLYTQPGSFDESVSSVPYRQYSQMKLRDSSRFPSAARLTPLGPVASSKASDSLMAASMSVDFPVATTPAI